MYYALGTCIGYIGCIGSKSEQYIVYHVHSILRTLVYGVPLYMANPCIWHTIVYCVPLYMMYPCIWRTLVYGVP